MINSDIFVIIYSSGKLSILEFTKRRIFLLVDELTGLPIDTVYDLTVGEMSLYYWVDELTVYEMTVDELT